MKLKDILKSKIGLYAAVNFSDDTINRILRYCKNANIPNVLNSDEIHCTLAYSKTDVPSFEPLKAVLEIAKPIGFEVWPSSPNTLKDNIKYCIVMKIESEYLQNRFKHIMSLGATYDYDFYKPHISLSYDVPKDFDVLKLPSLSEIGNIEIISEYTESLNFD